MIARLIRWSIGTRPGSWASLGTLAMTAAEWEALLPRLTPAIEVYHGTPLFGEYYKRTAA